MKTRPSFEEIGLPKGHAYPELAYHPPTGSMIVHTRPLKSSLPCRRISLSVNGKRYRQIANFPPSISVEDYLLHPKLPLLYLITYSWSMFLGKTPGGDWDALYRFNLETGKSETLASKGSLASPNDYPRVWLNQLLSVSDDGEALYCRAAFFGVKRYYCISKLSIADRKIKIIKKLKTPFA